MLPATKQCIALLPAHPAQLWLMLRLARQLEDRHHIVWVLRDKDVTLEIARAKGLEHIVLSKASRGLFGNMLELLFNIIKVCRITRKHRITLWVTKYGAGNIGALLMGARSLSFNDDDIDIVPYIAMTSYPFASRILAPGWTRMGKYTDKTTRFRSSMEMLYLHPSRFQPSTAVLEALGFEHTKPFILIRLSALTAHHDKGIKGIADSFLDRLVSTFDKRFSFYISSEKPLAERFSHLRLIIPADRMHHIIAHASCLITDSLTMSLEAAVFGVSSVRLSDFGNNLSAFQAMQKYDCIHNFSPADQAEAFTAVQKILDNPALPALQKTVSSRILADFEDPLPVFTEAIRQQCLSD